MVLFFVFAVKKPTVTQLQQLRSTSKKKPGLRHQGKSDSLLNSNGSTTSANKRESSLLGDLHVDKLYLENLLLNPGTKTEKNPSVFFFTGPLETLPYLNNSSSGRITNRIIINLGMFLSSLISLFSGVRVAQYQSTQ